MKRWYLLFMLLVLCGTTVANAESLDGGSDIYSARRIEIVGRYMVSMKDSSDEWYAFAASEELAYYTVAYSNEDINTKLYLSVCDDSGWTIAKAEARKQYNNSINWLAEPGKTYYLQFSRQDASQQGRFAFSLSKAADEYGNDISNAGEIGLNQTVQTSFGGTGDVDVMKLTTQSGQAYYRADLQNQVDTSVYMTLLDENGIKLEQEGVNSKTNTYISWQAEPEKVYYLRFERGSYGQDVNGQYTVALSRTEDKEGNDIAAAVELALDSPVTASFDGTGDVDVMKLMTQKGRAYYRVDLQNQVDTSVYMTLIDENGIKLEQKDAYSGRNTYISWQAEPEKAYYLKFERDSYNQNVNGQYIVSLSRTEDKEGNTIQEALDLGIREKTIGSFDGSQDIDCFRLESGENANYFRATLTNETVKTTITMEVLDANGLKLWTADAGRERYVWLNWKTEPNQIYYLRLIRNDKNENGTYTLLAEEFEDQEPDEMSDSIGIGNGETKQLMLGGSSDIDWIALSKPDACSYVSLTISGIDNNGSLTATLYQGDGQEVESRRISKNSSWNKEIYQTPQDSYYIRMTGEQADAYEIKRTDITDVGGSSFEYAEKVLAGEQFALSFEKKEDADYVAFPSAGASILLTGPYKTSAYASVIDGYGQIIMSEQKIGIRETKLFTADREGLYLCIRGSNDRCALSCCETDQHITTVIWTVGQRPTCSNTGKRVKLCTVCGQVAVEETVEKTEHQPAEQYTVVKKASCEVAGEETLKCKDCHASIETRSIEATGHQNTGWTTILEASCEAEGLQKYSCMDCGKLLVQESIPAFGHIRGEKMTAVEPTCQQNGLAKIACRVCGVELEEEELPITNHQAGEPVTVLPTCEEAGRTQILCKFCDEVISEESFEPTGHIEGAKRGKKATCLAEGVEETLCSTCGEVIASEMIPQKDHVPGPMIVVNDATCDTDGLKANACMTCGTILEQEVIPMTGHSFEEWIQVKAPTIMEEGLQESSCSVCGTTQSNTIEKLGLLEGILGK